MVETFAEAERRWRSSGAESVTILVFGGQGQLGRALAAHRDVMALSRHQCDITFEDQIFAAIREHSPVAVINAAAYTAVDKAESERDQARLINAVAPGLIAEASARHRIPLIHISTDCVFGGDSDEPYDENDLPGPINAYGESKLAGERAVLAASPDNIVVRVSWLFSIHGTNFIHAILRLAATQDQLRIVSDQIGGPTFAPDFAQALLDMVPQLEGRGGLYHYCGAPFVSRADFAREILNSAGLNVTVNDIPTSDFPTPAQRPLNSRLDCRKIQEKFGLPQSDWRQGLEQIITELKVNR